MIVHSDHQPLASISQKPHNRAPCQRENTLLRAQAYNYTIAWKPGKNQIIVDILSRAIHGTEVKDDDTEDVHVHPNAQ